VCVFNSCEKLDREICVETVAVVYSNSAQEHLNTILYTGFVEELVDILELKDAHLTVCLSNSGVSGGIALWQFCAILRSCFQQNKA